MADVEIVRKIVHEEMASLRDNILRLAEVVETHQSILESYDKLVNELYVILRKGKAYGTNDVRKA